MKTLSLALCCALCCLPVTAATPPEPPQRAAQRYPPPDSAALEKALQGLSWRQFRSVVEAVPKLKAAVDAYGPAGWQFVQANYRRYGWKKNIDRLDDAQKNQLAGEIERARRIR